MTRGPRRSERKPSEHFGGCLRKWREAKDLTREVAADKLGIKAKGKDPGAYLSLIENGHKALPDDVLLKVSEVYGILPDEVLKQAYWPQLVFLPLIAMVDPGELSDDIIREIERGLREAERQELTHYIQELLSRRSLLARG